MAGAGNGGGNRGSTRADNNQPISGSNTSQKVEAIPVEMVVVTAETAAALAVGEAMVTAAMAGAMRQPWQQ